MKLAAVATPKYSTAPARCDLCICLECMMRSEAAKFDSAVTKYKVRRIRRFNGPQFKTMPMETVSKVVMLPYEYKERMRMTGIELPTDHKQPNPEMPLIYVTHPDNMEDEIWIPPTHEQSLPSPLDEDSDDGDSVFHDSAEIGECDDDSEDSKMKLDSMVEHTEHVDNTMEMWFYRTGWQNRGIYSSDVNGSKLLYYADIPWRPWGTSLTIRREGKFGPEVADVHRHGPGRPFEITFSDPQQATYLDAEDEGKLILRFGCIYSRTHRFKYRGRMLAWKNGVSKRKLMDLDTNEVIAEFQCKVVSVHTDGKLVIGHDYVEDEGWIDVIVTTALTYQQREREIRRRMHAAGGGGGP